MSDEIKRAIELLVSQIKDGIDADDALKFSQAAVNLANCAAAAINIANR